MGLNYDNLDIATRRFMLEELDLDVAHGTLYLSPRLSVQGRADYEDLLREALTSANDEALASNLRRNGRLNATEMRHKLTGGTIIVKVPITASETLAEGEFNRFYARGLCRRVLEDGRDEVQIYRGKEVRDPRPESQAMIGTLLNARALLEDLRTHIGVDTSLGLPPGPNSGLSVRIPI